MASISGAEQSDRRTDVTFSILVPSPSNFSIPPLDLHSDGYNVQIKLTPGDNTFTSAEFEMGVLKSYGSQILMGQLIFGYEYDSASREITICHSDYPSIKGMVLSTRPSESEERSIERASSSGFAADEGYKNQHWYHRAQLFHGASEAFKTICRQANDQLIEGLKKSDLSVIVRTMLPKLSTEVYHGSCPVFRHGEFFGHLTPEHIYLPSDKVTTIESQLNGLAYFNLNESFANATTTTEDTKPIGLTGKSWTKIWEIETKLQATACTTNNWPTPCSTKPFVGDARKGGHVVRGNQVQPIPTGGKCLLFPICGVHNDRYFVQAMRANKYQTAVALHLFGE